MRSDDDNGMLSGSAHAFARGGDEWNHQAKLLAPNGAAGDEFGDSVAIYEDSIVAGTHRDDNNGLGSGSPHIFVRRGDDSVQRGKLLSPDGAAADGFGVRI